MPPSTAFHKRIITAALFILGTWRTFHVPYYAPASAWGWVAKLALAFGAYLLAVYCLEPE